MSALSSRTAHEREPSATATADVRTHARMRVGRASCGYSRAGDQRHRHVGAFWAIGGFVVLQASPRTCARLPHSPMAERAPFAFKKTPPVCFVGEARGGCSRIPAGQCLNIGNRGRTPVRKPTDDGASLHMPLPWRSRPWHTAFATSNAEEHARVHTTVTAKNAISGHIFAIQAAARVTQVPHRARRRGHEPPPRF